MFMKIKNYSIKMLITGTLVFASMFVSFVKASEGSCCLKKKAEIQEPAVDSGCCHKEKESGHCGDEADVCKCLMGQSMAMPAEFTYSGTGFFGYRAELMHEQYSFLELKDIFRPPAV